MKLPDGTVLMHGDLEHRAPYDPRKAHEYYLRTRRLKGRRRGRVGDHLVAVPKPDPEKKPPKKGVDTKQYLSSVNKRLRELNKQLETKLKDAQSVKSTVKVPKRDGEDQPDSAEELKKKIIDLKGRLTSAIAKLEELANP
jgi:hypothetical protein